MIIICTCGGMMTLPAGITGYWPRLPYKCNVCGRLKYKNMTQAKPLKSLAQHETERQAVFAHSLLANMPRPNGLACPYCQSELWDSAPMTLLTSYPPQLQVHCEGCGWKGTRLR